ARGVTRGPHGDAAVRRQGAGIQLGEGVGAGDGVRARAEGADRGVARVRRAGAEVVRGEELVVGRREARVLLVLDVDTGDGARADAVEGRAQEDVQVAARDEVADRD